MELLIGAVVIVVLVGLAWGFSCLVDFITRDEDGYPKP